MRTDGLIHLYFGDGKGKTTAALGLALRAAGRGRSVWLARFMKHDDSGELEALRTVRGIRVLPCKRSFGFSWTLTQEEREEAAACYEALLEQAWEEAERGMTSSGGLLILDEAVGTCALGFLREERLLTLLAERPDGLEVVLTGRNPSEALLAAADYATEMVMRRHPYERGIRARKGIEY